MLTTKIEEVEKAYIAGFLDGDGSISFSKTHCDRKQHTTIIRVRIRNTNKDVLEWIMTRIGMGKIRQSHPPEHLHLARYELEINGKNGLELIKVLYPYLIVKRINADIAMKFEPTMIGTGKILTTEQRAYRIELKKAMTEALTHQRG